MIYIFTALLLFNSPDARAEQCKLSPKQCLSSALNLFEEGDHIQALRITDSSCRKGSQQACKEIAIMYRKMNNLKMATLWDKYVCTRSQKHCLQLISGFYKQQNQHAEGLLINPCLAKKHAGACSLLAKVYLESKQHKKARVLSSKWCKKESLQQNDFCLTAGRSSLEEGQIKEAYSFSKKSCELNLAAGCEMMDMLSVSLKHQKRNTASSKVKKRRLPRVLPPKRKR